MISRSRWCSLVVVAACGGPAAGPHDAAVVTDGAAGDGAAGDAAHPDAPPEIHVLGVAITGLGTATVASTPASIACPTTCAASFADGTPITLTATPAQGVGVAAWHGACAGTALTATATLAGADATCELELHWTSPHWARTYGTGIEERAFATVATAGGNAITVGWASDPVNGPFDGMVIATDAAGAVTWQHRYATVNQDELEGVVELANHDVLAVGREYLAGRGADAWWMRLDPTGAIVSQATFGDANNETIHGVTRTSGGAVLVGEQQGAAVTRALVIALDDAGAVRWSHLLLPAGASTATLAAATTLANGDVLAVGARDNTAWFVELDDTGAIVRERAIANPGANPPTAAFTAVTAAAPPATGWLAGGTLGRPASPYRDAWLVRADATGAITWQQTYSAADTVLGLAATSAGGFVAAGETQFDQIGDVASGWLLAIADTGAVQYERQYGSSVVSASGALHGVATAADGRVIAAGHDSGWGAGSYDAWLVSADATGKIGNATCPAYVATPLTSTVTTSTATATATTSTVTGRAAPVSAPGTAGVAPLGATVESVCYE